MFTPFKLCVRNFMSFGNNETLIRLDFTNPTLIVGRNHDSAVDGQLDSNGAGKTTILNAINYVLYGTIISDKAINADDYINNINRKDMYVSLTFTTGNNTFYKVERYRKNKDKGGNGVRVFMRQGGKPDDAFDDSHDVTPDSVANADTKITQIMGMAFEVFSRIVAFSATHKPFLFLPASEQTAIVEDICGLSELSEKAAILKTKSRTDSQELDRLNEINKTIKAQRDQIIAQIESATQKRDEWDAGNRRAIETFQNSIIESKDDGVDYDEQIELIEFVQAADARIAEYEASKRELITERNSINATIQKCDTWLVTQMEKISNAERAVREYKSIPSDEIIQDIRKLAELTTRNRESKSQISALMAEKSGHDRILLDKKKELSHLHDATCPYCSQNFADAKSKAVEVEALIEMTEKKSTKVQVEIDSIELGMVGITDEIKVLEGKWEFKTEREVMEYQGKYDTLVERLRQIGEEKNPYQIDKTEANSEIEAIDADIKKLDNMITKRRTKKETVQGDLKYATVKEVMAAKNHVARLAAEVERLTNEKNPLSSTVDELKSIILEATKDDEVEELMKLIEHQQFLVKLLTKKDSFIRKLLLQKSLPFLNSRLRYYLDRIGFLHRVAFNEDLSVTISQFGNNIGFANLSSGQKARINLALSFSFRDMLQARHGKLKFCILDECLDVGLGNVGVQLAAKMIKSVATDEKLSMFVISHRDEISNMFDSKLVVELKNGFSTIETES